MLNHASRRGLLFLYIVLFMIPAPLYAATGNGVPEVRVKVFHDVSTLRIEGHDVRLIDTYRNLYIFKNRGISSLVVSVANNGISVNNAVYPARMVTLVFSDGMVRINGKLLRGHLEIANENNRDLIVVNAINLESYVAGLVNAEMPHNWPIEALEAQAVVARTYALWQKDRHLDQYYDMENGVMDQVYKGVDSENNRGWAAVNATRGQIITYDGKPILAMYHSICGGETENSEDAIGYKYPYLRAVTCNFCRFAPHYFWKYTLGFRTLAYRMIAKGYNLSEVDGFSILKRSRTQRVMTARVVTNKGLIDLDGVTLRGIIGFDRLRSTLFWIKVSGNTIFFHGRGFGHGVGMCQWGAYGMAKKGSTYRQIIHYYYQHVHIERLY